MTERAEGSSSLFAAREKRLGDACALRRPDRVPVAPLVHYYPACCKRLPHKVMHYDLSLRNRLLREATVSHDWDAAPPCSAVPEGRPLELLGATQYQLPGWGLEETRPFQFREGEYMLQEEYDELLAEPQVFTLRKLWPRVAARLAPVAEAAGRPLPPLLYAADGRGLAGLVGSWLGQPGVAIMLQSLLELAAESRAADQAAAAYAEEMSNLGYPLLFGATALTAFDCVSDFLRGLRGTLLDMYQVPDKLLAVIEMLIPWTIEETLAAARRSGNPRVFIALHRGAAGFMSNEQFAKFYWPGLKALLVGLVEAGLTPLAFFEGDYTPRLGFLEELPAGRIIGHFDRVDRREARDFIGRTLCFWGNVPASLLCTGTVEEVRRDVHELLELFAGGGGLILDGGVGIPDEAKPENVAAMSLAAREWA